MEQKTMIKERIQKISKILSVLLKIARIACMIGIGVLTGGIIWVMLNGNLDLLVLNDHVILRAPFDSELLKSFDQKKLLVLLFIMLIRTIMLVLLLTQAENMFKDISQDNSPFEMKHVHRIRKMAIFYLIIVMCNVNDFKTIQDFQYTFDFTGIVAAAMFWCLSIIFEYGCSLQVESDETL